MIYCSASPAVLRCCAGPVPGSVQIQPKKRFLLIDHAEHTNNLKIMLGLGWVVVWFVDWVG